MPSPFPGMNPYLEQPDVWPDFHDCFLMFARETLATNLGPRYFVRIQEQVYIHELAEETRHFLGRPDLAIHERIPPTGSTAIAGAVLNPTTARIAATVIDEIRLNRLEIVDRRDRSVVSAIELLSPSNKAPGPDRVQYLRKVRNILASPAGFVEIDLLRGGPRMPWEDVPPGDYCVIASAASRRPAVACWSFGLRDPLPTITVPLREVEVAVPLDLQAVLNRAYDSAGYDSYLYDGQPDPRLTSSDQEWARSILEIPAGSDRS